MAPPRPTAIFPYGKVRHVLFEVVALDQFRDRQ
jgi:hypothetical protein